MKLTRGILVMLCFFASLGAEAQNPPLSGDVCCFGVEMEGEQIKSVFAEPMNVKTCEKGKKSKPIGRSGRTICGFSADLDSCADVKLADICEKCGYHWLETLGKCSKKSLKELLPKDESDDQKSKKEN